MLKNIGIGFSWIAPGFLTLLLSLPAGLSAQEEASGGQGEPSGVLFRGSLGAGSVSTDYDEEIIIGVDSTSSTGADVSVLLGGFVSDNVALHGSLGVFNSGDADEGLVTISYDYNFIKGGASIYFGNDFYISPEIRVPLSGEIETEVGIGFVTIPVDAADIEGDGVGFGLTFGKEWHAGNHAWGFGLFLAFVQDPLLVKLEDRGIDDISFTNTYTSIGISVAYR